MESDFDRPMRAHKPAESAACRPEMLLDDQLDLAREAFRQFLDRAAAALLRYLSCPIEVAYAGADQLPLSEALGKLESGACVASMDLSPIPGVAYLTLERQLVGTALEILMGAPADAPEIPRASLTAVDLHILQDLVALLADEVRGTWKPLCGCSFLAPSARAAGTGAGAAADDCSALVLTAKVVLNGGTGALQFIVPSVLIRAAFAQPSRADTVPPAPRDALFDAVCSASFGLEAVLRGSGIRIRDLLDLKAGDTLALPYKTDAPVECQVNGVVKYRGALVGSGESVGFQIGSEA